MGSTLGHRIGIGELSRRTNLSKAHVSKIFNGLRRPSMKAARKISRVLEITMDELYDHLDTLRRAA